MPGAGVFCSLSSNYRLWAVGRARLECGDVEADWRVLTPDGSER
jgi:hypothetical protein